MPKEKTTLVILTYDEIDCIKKLFPDIPLDAVDEVICMDAGSTDGTIEFLKEKGIPVYVQKVKGRGNAFVEALDIAKGENLIFFSGDGNEDPRDIPKMKRYLEEGYELVIAGRFLMKGSVSDDSDDQLRIRKLGNIFFSTLVRVLWKTGVNDAINGFRGMKKVPMRRMNLDAPKHEIEIQSTVRAAKLGLKVKEFPTRELLRLGGERKPTAGTWVLGYTFVIFVIKEILIGKNFIKEK